MRGLLKRIWAFFTKQEGMTWETYHKAVMEYSIYHRGKGRG